MPLTWRPQSASSGPAIAVSGAFPWRLPIADCRLTAKPSATALFQSTINNRKSTIPGGPADDVEQGAVGTKCTWNGTGYGYTRRRTAACYALGSQSSDLDGGAFRSHRISRPLEGRNSFRRWSVVARSAGAFRPWGRLARFPCIENAEPFGGPHGAFPSHLAGTRGSGSFCRPCRVRLGSGCCRAQRCLWIAASLIRGGRVEEATRWSVVATRDGGGARSSFCSPLPTHIWRAVHGSGRGVRQHRQENLPRELPASIYPLLCGRPLRLVCRWIPARHAVGQGDTCHRGETPPFLLFGHNRGRRGAGCARPSVLWLRTRAGPLFLWRLRSSPGDNWPDLRGICASRLL